MARGRESGAYRFDQRIAHPVHGAHRVELGRRNGEGCHRFVPGDLARALAEDERVPRRDALHTHVRSAVTQRLRCLGAGEQRGQVADVQLRLDQVGERECGGRVRRAAGPRCVEDRAGSGEVPDDGDPSAYLDDGRVTACPER